MIAWSMLRTRSLSVRITAGVLGGRGVADGVGDVDGRRAGLDGRLDDLAEEVELGAGGVLGAETRCRGNSSWPGARWRRPAR